VQSSKEKGGGKKSEAHGIFSWDFITPAGSSAGVVNRGPTRGGKKRQEKSETYFEKGAVGTFNPSSLEDPKRDVLRFTVPTKGCWVPGGGKNLLRGLIHRTVSVNEGQLV